MTDGLLLVLELSRICAEGGLAVAAIVVAMPRNNSSGATVPLCFGEIASKVYFRNAGQ